ncbi:AraC family transcriptional regulator [Patulibacter sp.]|uniref:AraC family transcriptional regulator n=1 Tax=Patulibacter sp. TaxID=1912859 RepID=UPI00271C628F|nr:AraC family transcriptional regulator [Patulibacter sp.]MDO9406959.1 AraC family transcriptional regulator [Patulibacter sp.]
MDVFSDVMRGVRADDSTFGRSTLRAPWALRFDDGPPLTLVSVLHGSGWIVPDGRPPEHLGARDTVVVCGPAGFAFVDEIGTTAPTVPCGERRSTLGRPGSVHRRGWCDAAPDAPGSTTVVVGAYPVGGEISYRLLDALPTVIRVPAVETGDPVLDHLAAEIAVDAPGQQAVLDRLLDWLLVCTLREWFDRPGNDPPAWWAAQRDPVVGAALRLLHADPAATWTVAGLAARTGVSRSTLARRFAELLGEGPLTYLARWRMTLAADLLSAPEPTMLEEVAQVVGYADAFAFSTAFKRIRGVSPSEFRRRATALDRSA